MVPVYLPYNNYAPMWWDNVTPLSTGTGATYFSTNSGTTSATTPWISNALGHIYWYTPTEDFIQGVQNVTHEEYYNLARGRVEMTAERRREHEARVLIAAQERERRHQEAVAARARSRELLLSSLNEKQRATFEKHNWFIVEGGESRQKYRIRDLGHLRANVDVLVDTGRDVHRVAHRLCAHANEYEIPLYDNLLAQKLALEGDESYFLRIANRHAA